MMLSDCMVCKNLTRIEA